MLKTLDSFFPIRYTAFALSGVGVLLCLFTSIGLL